MHTRGGRGSTARRIGITVALLICAAIVCACDSFYEVVVENRTEQDVTVHVEGHTMEVNACSVWYTASMSASPGARKLAVEATDSDGKLVFEDQVAPVPVKGGLPRLHIVVSASGEGSCPAEVGQYYVSVTNDSDRDLDVIHGDLVLGHVAAHSAVTLGPVAGLVIEAPLPDVRDPQGGDVLHGDFVVASRLEYGMGDTPTYMLWVQPGSRE